MQTKIRLAAFGYFLRGETLIAFVAAPRPRQLALYGGNGLARVSIEKPIPGQFETSVHFSKSLRS